MFDELIQQHNIKEETIKLIDEYEIRGFTIRIFQKSQSIFYQATPIIDFSQNPLFFGQLSSLVYKNRELLGKRILTFDELVDTIKAICLWKVQSSLKEPLNSEIVVELFIYKLIKLEKLMPLFIDPKINEIYMDQQGTEIYIDHQNYGRCNTEIILSAEELSALLTRLKLEHPITISPKNPSFKIEFITNLFHLRISMDFPPLSPNGPSFNIRKLKKQPLTVPDLIKFKSITPSAAAYLIVAIQHRKNITIIGEPNSGKTTLANALDLYTPKYWRKVAVEDAIETINKSQMGFKQLTIRVDSFESNKNDYTKSAEILKLLHRSPDWIFLGEIQSKEHTQAMFEALNAGLKGIQTTHADSIQKIFRRWKNLHNIDETDFLSLDILVVMKREIREQSIIRKVSAIYEVDKSSNYDRKLQFLQTIYQEGKSEDQIIEDIHKKSSLGRYISTILATSKELKSSIESSDRKTMKVKDSLETEI